MTGTSFHERAQVVLEMIRHSVATRGYPPTRQEIADRLGFAGRGSTQPLIDRMVREGLITVEPGRGRTITIKGGAMVAPREEM